MKHAFVVTVGLSTALAVSACSNHTPSPSAALPSVAVATAVATEHDLAQPFEVGGVVRAREVATVVSRIMAEVRAVAVKPGDRVRAGHVLVLLDARELDANRERAVAGQAGVVQSAALADADRQAADAALTLARLTHERVSDLRAKNSATPHELDEAVAALRGAEARVKVADARLAEAKAGIAASAAGAAAAHVAVSYTRLVAPFDGLVTEKLIDPGNMAIPGQPLLTVEDTRSFRLEVRLDESRAQLVRTGEMVEVRLDRSTAAGPASAEPGEPVRGRIGEVSRRLDSGSHDSLVKIDLPHTQGLRSGMFGRVVLQSATHRAIGIPASALSRRGQLVFVFVVDAGNKARLRLVSASDATNGLVEVRSGLTAGERVVTVPPAALTDGSPVTAVAGEVRQ